MNKFGLYVALCCLAVCINALPAPQGFEDIATAAAMAGAQVLQAFEKDVALRDGKEIEFMGFGARNNFEMGTGDAIRRNKRAVERKMNVDSSSSSSGSSDTSEE